MGTDNTVTTLEDMPYTFAEADFGFTDPNNTPPNNLLAVEITTLPADGALTDDGVPVTAGQFVSVGDISSGKLQFSPAPDGNGASYASFTFQVQDDGGTANGGTDLDPTARTMTIDVTSVNDAPEGADLVIPVLENASHTFAASDFGFSDPNDTPANNLSAVIITTLPTAGSLTLDGAAVTGGDSIGEADISAGKLVFTPDPNANGSPYATFTFQVQDDGGTANGGVDMDPTPNTITLNVVQLNDAPTGADNTVTTLEDTPYTFSEGDFGFSDAGNTPPDNLLAVTITTLPADGTLATMACPSRPANSSRWPTSRAAIFCSFPRANANGTSYASFTFQVQDDGGTDYGGVDIDPTPNTMTLDVTSVNDAPAGADKTVTTLEDADYMFTVADFGFSDTSDTPANNFVAVQITTLPTAGTLTDNGTAVTAGQFIPVADITGRAAEIHPGADANGTAYATFTFQVQDDGGTANGGVDLDPTPNTMTIDVTSVNDAPSAPITR